MSRSPSLAVALSCGLALALGVVRPAHAAPARHSGSLAACAALQARHMADAITDDTYGPPHPAAEMADAYRFLPDVAATWEAENVAARQAFKPSATRDYMIWIETEQRCKGIDHGLDKPMPVTVEVTVTNTVTISR